MQYDYRRPSAQTVTIWCDRRRHGMTLRKIARLYGYSISCVWKYTDNEAAMMRKLRG